MVLNILEILITLIFSWFLYLLDTQLAFTFSKLTIETLEQGVKYVQG